MIPLWSVLIFVTFVASETCYVIPDPIIQRNLTVCDPVPVTDVLTRTDFNNLTAWYILPQNVAGGAFVMTMSLESWSSLESDAEARVKSKDGAVYLNFRLFDAYGTDYTNNRWPNVTYSKDKRNVTITMRVQSLLFFRLWVTYINDPPVNIGNVTSRAIVAQLTVNLPMASPLDATLPPGTWAFASWNFGAWASSQNTISYLQTLVECDAEEGMPKDTKPSPLFVSVTSCQYAFTCEYPMQPALMKSTVTYALPFGSNNGPVTYSVGYPQYYPQGTPDFYAIVSIYNNNTRSCRVRVDTYYAPITIFTFGSLTNLSSGVSTLSPYRYQPFMIMVPGTNSFLTNETIYFRLTPQKAKINSTSRLALVYHEYPYNEDQDFVSAQWNRTQSTATETFETDFLAFSPYQPFAVANVGLEDGSYYIEVSKNPSSGPSVLFWVLIGLLCFSVVTLFVTGVIAIRYYVGRKNSGGYSEIR